MVEPRKYFFEKIHGQIKLRQRFTEPFRLYCKKKKSIERKLKKDKKKKVVAKKKLKKVKKKKVVAKKKLKKEKKHKTATKHRLSTIERQMEPLGKIERRSVFKEKTNVSLTGTKRKTVIHVVDLTGVPSDDEDEDCKFLYEIKKRKKTE